MMTGLAIAIGIYLVMLLGVSFWTSTQVKSSEDFIVAGRRLPVSLATFTLLATWFGAGTLLTATDEIFDKGLSVTALEPYGAGACLILAGLFFAKPLWEMRLCTFSDFYRLKFGARAEKLSVLLTIPGYVGWVAVQLIALGGILNLFFNIPVWIAILAVATVSMIFTIIGGMWSVTITDSIQLLLVFAGLITLGYEVFKQLGDHPLAEIDPGRLILIPRENLSEFMSWTGVFLVSALGNIPGQDLGQRIFASRSSQTAAYSCLLAGLLYIALGSIPVFLGIVAPLVLNPQIESSIIPALARAFLSPAMTVLFVLSLISVVLSTITSAILAPATTVAHNYLNHRFPHASPLRICHYCVAGVTIASVLVAFSGEETYFLLEAAYAVGLVCFFPPLMIGLCFGKRSEGAMLAGIVVGTLVWIPEFFFESEFPYALAGCLTNFGVYFLLNGWQRPRNVES